MLTSKLNLRVVNSVFLNQVRGIQSNDSLLDNCTQIRNKNPRNLEFLTIARRPSGYLLEKVKKDSWHTVSCIKHSRFITLQLNHFENGTIISVSTKDWPFKKQLSTLTDTAAYINLARVFAQRCLESGITLMTSRIGPDDSHPKNRALRLELKRCGIILNEPKRFLDPTPWEKFSKIKPWEINP